jgi:phage terminase small subunit
MKQFWLDTNTKFEFDDHQLKLLEAACGAWDRMTQARLALAKQGLTYQDDKGGIRPRPEIAIERDSRVAFARLLRELHLDDPDRGARS